MATGSDGRRGREERSGTLVRRWAVERFLEIGLFAGDDDEKWNLFATALSRQHIVSCRVRYLCENDDEDEY